MALFEEEIVTSHFVETASRNRRSRKVTRYHHPQGTHRAVRQLPPPAAPGIRLIRRNETMRRIEGEEIVGHIGRNPLVRTRGTHLAGKIGRVRDFT